MLNKLITGSAILNSPHIIINIVQSLTNNNISLCIDDVVNKIAVLHNAMLVTVYFTMLISQFSKPKPLQD